MRSYLRNQVGEYCVDRLGTALFELLDGLLTVDPKDRMSASDALSLDYFKENTVQRLLRNSPSVLLAENRIAQADFLKNCTSIALPCRLKRYNTVRIDCMISWLEDVFVNLQLTEDTLPYAVLIFKVFVEKELPRDGKEVLDNLKLIAISCLVLAIFLNEVKYIDIDTVIGYCKKIS